MKRQNTIVCKLISSIRWYYSKTMMAGSGPSGVGHSRPPPAPLDFFGLLDRRRRRDPRVLSRRWRALVACAGSSASRVIDSRIDIALLLADPTRTGVH